MKNYSIQMPLINLIFIIVMGPNLAYAQTNWEACIELMDANPNCQPGAMNYGSWQCAEINLQLRNLNCRSELIERMRMGESQEQHKKWIDVLSLTWGTGQN